MNASKHTPGPWRIVNGNVVRNDAEADFVRATTTSLVLNPPKRRRISAGERKANAALIAAAPDLLAACEAVQSSLTMMLPYTAGMWQKNVQASIDTLRAAIAKATGGKVGVV